MLQEWVGSLPVEGDVHSSEGIVNGTRAATWLQSIIDAYGVKDGKVRIAEKYTLREVWCLSHLLTYMCERALQGFSWGPTCQPSGTCSIICSVFTERLRSLFTCTKGSVLMAVSGR